MKLWTVLWITFVGGPFDGERTMLVYPALEACLAAHQAVSDTLPYDHQIACVETRVPSAPSIRPQARPW